jgi:drug/metabolite transporter (DMT)-like permease
MKNKIMIGSLSVVIAALFWSLDGTFLRPNLYQLPSLLVVFLEHFLGFVVLFPFLILYRHQIKLINRKQWGAIFWVALFGGVLGTTFMTKALFLTGFKDISVVILLQKFQPVFAILIASMLVGERFPKKFYIYSLIAVLAGYFVTFKNPLLITSLPSTTYLVPLYALLAAFAWGSSTAFGKYSITSIHYGVLTALRFGITALIMVIPALYLYWSSISLITSKQWGIFGIIVFTSGALSMYLYYFGLKKIPASVATLCELAWPVSAIIFDYFLNHNSLSPTQLIGAVVLLIAVYKAVETNQKLNKSSLHKK